MSSDSLSPDASLNYYTHYTTAGKNAENKKSFSTASLPGIILFHQGFYKDINDDAGRRLINQFSAKGFYVAPDSKQVSVHQTQVDNIKSGTVKVRAGIKGIADKQKADRNINASYTSSPSSKKAAFYTKYGSGFPNGLSSIIPDDACVVSPANCINDMAGYTFPIERINKGNPLSYAKPNISPIPGFHDVKYKDDQVTPFADDYGTGDDVINCGGDITENQCYTDPSELNYVVYYPNQIDYTNCKLPGILLFHAGGYSDCSNYNYEDSLCYALARKGFIVYNIEYRRGRIKDGLREDGNNFTSVQQMLAIYRAFQDGRGAIRSIIKRQRTIAYNHLPYQVDTSNLFVAGQSAGATIANSLAYYHTLIQISAVFPVHTGDPSIESALGPIDADFYYGTPDIEYYKSIKGLWSMWGGFPIPVIDNIAVDEYNFLSNGGIDTLVPMIGFMGVNDPVFPIQKKFQNIRYPLSNGKHDPYITEDFCLIGSYFKVYSINKNDIAFRIECTNDIYKILKDNGRPTLQYLDCDMGHGLDHVCQTCICFTDFGAPNTVLTLNQVNEYLAARACFFFQSILNGTAGSLAGAQKFKNCLDSRHSDSTGACVTAAQNAGCSNGDDCVSDTSIHAPLIIKNLLP